MLQLERLARHATLAPDERAQLEAEVLAALRSDWTTASALAEPLSLHWPAALQRPAVRAVYQLGLEASAFSSEQRRAVVGPLLRTEERLDEVLMHAERLALGTRLRLASLCRHTCVAASRVPELLEGGRGAVLDRVLAALFRDRDPQVALHAAWALGLRETPIVSETLTRARADGAPPHLRRRAMIAALSRAFDRDAAALEGILRSELLKGEPAARALLMRALGLGPASAPALASAMLADEKAPEVQLAFLEQALERGELPRDLGELRVGEAAPKKLRWLVHPESALDQEFFQAFVGLREAARRSALEAHAAARRALPLVAHDHPGAEALLFDGTWLQNALTAEAPSPARGSEVKTFVKGLDELEGARTRAIERVGSEKGSALRDALGYATRALDASAREPALADDADRLLRALAPHLLGAPDKALVRPLAYAWITAIEAAALARVDSFDRAVATALCTAPALLRHAAQATTVAALANALTALATLRSTLDDARKSKGDPGVILTALLDTLRAVSPLSGPTSPTRRTLEAAVVAVDAHVMFAREQIPDAAAPWTRALEESSALRRALHEVLGVPAPELPADKRRVGAVAALFRREKADKAMPADNAKKALSATLPPLLSDLYDALAAVLGRESHATRPTVAQLDLAAGEIIGDFVVDKTLGKGGMGSCLLVRRRVAAKDPKAPRFVLKLPLRREQLSLDLFIDEATTLLQLAKAPHPGVVEFISCATRSYRVPFLVMAWVAGVPLDERIRRGPLPVGEVVPLGAALAEALAHCHRHEITHHDVKPGNVILAADGHPVLVDFGISSAARRTGAGSLQYMAPERFGGRLEGADWPSDVFALGCVLYEALTGRGLLDPPLHGGERQAMADVASIADGILTGAPLSTQQVAIYYAFAAHRSDVLAERIKRALIGHAPLAELLAQMVARDPTTRPRASHVAAILRATASGR